MTDFLAALGLVFVIEGLIFAAFPEAAKRAMKSVLETPDVSLRLIGNRLCYCRPGPGLAGAGVTGVNSLARY